MARRFGGLLALLILAAGPVQAAIPASGALHFDILREGSTIGSHSFRFARSGERVDVNIDIEIEVKILLLTVFAYRHSNHETWIDGRLVRLRTRTDDDGEALRVDGEATADGFRVETATGNQLITWPVMPTSYWRTDTVEARRMLNTQTGEVMDVTITRGDETLIVSEGREIEARHFVIGGDLQLELWYDADDVLSGLRFMGQDGSAIEYRRRAAPPGTAE